MDVRLGYAANCLTLGITASHTCRVANATPRRLAELTATNLAELERMLLFNEANGIEVFRIGSSLVPLASHPVNRTRWWSTFARDFARLGAIAARSGQRLSMHPSPAGASLASARPEVREAAVRELRYATRVLDLLGQGPEARVVVHLGGAAPARTVALDAARRFLDAMPDDARRRIAVENDDRIWSAREVFALARGHGLPMVADQLHDAILPSTPPLGVRALFDLARPTWTSLGLRPKYHVASQRAGARPGAHAELVDPADWRAVLEALRHPADLMLEAKGKDRAVFALRALGLAAERTHRRDGAAGARRAGEPSPR
ncbi:MAG TPA: UV DNA damage repair endonuclease UvsE [Anaeromyxobacteraceae bacterium]|nr:UV DNA damage repair endonuclease UvsE [Anaeromyxobacteraceae bacterium]